MIFENPDAFVLETRDYFAATPEMADRGYWGLNTHAMLLTPDRRIFRQLLWRAGEGWYLANTNSEQDLLEAQFVYAGDPQFPAHYHTNHHREHSDGEVASKIFDRVSASSPAAIQCYREASGWVGKLSGLKDQFVSVGFRRGDRLVCGAAPPRGNASACADAQIDLRPEDLPPKRSNTNIPDFASSS